MRSTSYTASAYSFATLSVPLPYAATTGYHALILSRPASFSSSANAASTAAPPRTLVAASVRSRSVVAPVSDAACSSVCRAGLLTRCMTPNPLSWLGFPP